MLSFWDALVKHSPSGNMEKRIELETANNCEVIKEILLIHWASYSIVTTRECVHWTRGVGLSSYWDHSNNPGIKVNTKWSCSYVESLKTKKVNLKILRLDWFWMRRGKKRCYAVGQYFWHREMEIFKKRKTLSLCKRYATTYSYTNKA